MCLLLGGPHDGTLRHVDRDWVPHGMFLKAPDGSEVLYRARVLALRRAFRFIEVQLYTTDAIMPSLTPDAVDGMLRARGLYPYN